MGEHEEEEEEEEEKEEGGGGGGRDRLSEGGWAMEGAAMRITAAGLSAIHSRIFTINAR